ncbi:MAG TPA: energy transducer TonB [Steroidobacteraceae bacterium]|nr:energy transducer TonB [Steroidobacteraceae bacterium]
MPSPSSARPHDGAEGSAPTHSSARATAEIIAVTTRDDFLLEMGEALSGATAVRPVDSIATALEQLASSRKVQLLAVDARDIDDLRGDIERVNSQVPHIVTLVFASADAEKQTAFALKGTNVFAVLSIPIDRRKAAAVIEGAVADAVARRPAGGGTGKSSLYASSASAPITVEPAHTGADFSGPSGSGSGNKKPMLMIGLGLAAVVVASVAFWFFMLAPATPSAPAADEGKRPSVSISADAANLSDEDVVAEKAPVVDLALVNGTVDELLEKARAAMRERRYTEPNNDNALLYYRSAVKVDPTNGEASDGLKRIASVLSARFDEALGGGRYDEAALALAHLKVATPDDPRNKELEGKLATAQITKMLADNNLDRAASLVKGAQQSGSVPDAQIAKWRAEIKQRQDDQRQTRLVNLAQDRIKDGRLGDSDDSAEAYLNQLKDMGPAAASAAQRVQRDIAAAYLRKAREAFLNNKSSDMERWVAEARSLGVSASELNAFNRDLQSQKQRAQAAQIAELVGAAQARVKDGRLLDPANDSAAFYLTQLQSVDPNNSYLVAGSRELATKLLDRASAYGRDNKTAQMEADLTQAKRWGADQKDIDAIRQASLSRRNQPKPATAANGRSSPADLQAKLKRTRYTAPEYPERALAQKISGSVTVEFTVSTSGEPIDIRVVSAEPAGTFDRAAIAAVKRWRYEPLVIDNVPQEVPARTTIRFNLPSE